MSGGSFGMCGDLEDRPTAMREHSRGAESEGVFDQADGKLELRRGGAQTSNGAMGQSDGSGGGVIVCRSQS